MPQSVVVPQKSEFLSELKKLTPGWSIASVKVHGLADEKPVFALTPTTEGPMYVGDDIGINDPLIPIENPKDAFYGFSFGIGTNELPDDPKMLTRIWKKALATYELVKNAENQARGIYCPACKTAHGYSVGRSKRGHFCHKCFGLGYLYPVGPQKKLGRKLLQGSRISRANRSFDIRFKPEALLALLDLYDTYHTGLVTDIAQKYLPNYPYSVLWNTFSGIVIYVGYDHKADPGLCDFAYDFEKKLWYRHFYICQNDKYVNLYTGKEEIVDWNKLSLVSSNHVLPTQDRWNVTLDIMRNLCKLVKK